MTSMDVRGELNPPQRTTIRYCKRSISIGQQRFRTFSPPFSPTISRNSWPSSRRGILDYQKGTAIKREAETKAFWQENKGWIETKSSNAKRTVLEDQQDCNRIKRHLEEHY